MTVQPRESLVFNIAPMGKPRMVRSDRWAGREVVARYWDYKDELNKQARRLMFEIGEKLNIEFFLPMPQSWSQKKKTLMDGTPHMGKPDLDNIIKGFLDCLTDDDSDVWTITASKRWAYEGSIKILI